MRPLRIEEVGVLRSTREQVLRELKAGRPLVEHEVYAFDRRIARRSDKLRAELGIVWIDGIAHVPDDWTCTNGVGPSSQEANENVT